jgi:hypothetical protein
MALIEYKINLDGSGKVVVTSIIRRLDPGDEILVVTETPNAALQWKASSPFASPAAEEIYVLPQASASGQPLQVTRAIDLSQELAQCGEGDGKGNFVPWLQSGGGFPGIEVTN